MSKLTNIAGTFVIQASASFLNGAGLGEGEDRNVTIPKTLQDGRRRVPYVSAQAWKRWLRDTLIEETGWKASVLKAIGDGSEKNTTNKISGELDPIGFPEDDIFGYMRAQKNQGKKAAEEDEGEGEEDAELTEDAAKGKSKKTPKVKAVMRSSPFSASILVSLRKDGWRGRDEGLVHLKEGTPLPYTTEFYTTSLQGIFCLAHHRLGVFSNEGDRIELDEAIAAKHLAASMLTKTATGYELTNAEETRKLRTSALLNALAVLRGGAKQAAFGTDVAPKCLIMAGMSCGNPIFNHLFEDDPEKGVTLKIETFKQVLSDYADRIVTPVVIGHRTSYLANEKEVEALKGAHKFDRGTVEIVVLSPVDAAAQMAKYL